MQETSQPSDAAECSLSIVDATQFSACFKDLCALYERSFQLPPYRRGAVEERMKRHLDRADFTASLVRNFDGSLAGFSYGFRGMEGDWWHQRVRGNMSSALALQWMPDSFEIAEVAVDPDYQGRGIGAMLVDELRKTTTCHSVLLTVRIDNARARRLYERLGFQELIDSLTFSGDDYPYAVMGFQND